MPGFRVLPVIALALTLGACVATGPVAPADVGLAPIPGAMTEAQARRACLGQLGAAYRPVDPVQLHECMRVKTFGTSPNSWD